MPPPRRKHSKRQALVCTCKRAEERLLPAADRLVDAIAMKSELKALTDALFYPMYWAPAPKPSSYPRPSQIVASKEERRVLSLTNSIRARKRLPPVKIDPALTAAAKAHTLDQAFRRRSMSHKGSDGSAVSHRVLKRGYNYRFVAENVAHGHVSAQHVVDAWMKSPGHRRNILSKYPRHMGVYVVKGFDGRLFWTQVFGSRL